MVALKVNEYADFCEIEDKRFSVSLGRESGAFHLLEVRRNFSFSVLLSRVAVCWLARIVEDCLTFVSEVRFWRRYVGNNFSIIVDVMINKRGSCLRLLKVAQGKGRMLLIPEGSRRNGWRGFAKILRSTLNRWSANQFNNNKVHSREVSKEVSFVEAVQGQKRIGKKVQSEQTFVPHFSSEDPEFAGGVCRRCSRKNRSSKGKKLLGEGDVCCPVVPDTPVGSRISDDSKVGKVKEVLGINEPDQSINLIGCDLDLKSEDFLSRTGDQIALIHFSECAWSFVPLDLGHGMLSESALARDDSLEALDGVAALFDFDFGHWLLSESASGCADSFEALDGVAALFSSSEEVDISTAPVSRIKLFPPALSRDSESRKSDGLEQGVEDRVESNPIRRKGKVVKIEMDKRDCWELVFEKIEMDKKVLRKMAYLNRLRKPKFMRFRSGFL